MGSVAELKDAVKEVMQRKGVLPKLQAQIRSQVFSMLLDAEDAPRPEPCDETLLINELIREFLVFHGLRDTLAVFLPESGQPATRPFEREFLAQRLHIHDTPVAQQIPLLYHVVSQQQQQHHRMPGQTMQQPRLQRRQQQVAGSDQQDLIGAAADVHPPSTAATTSAAAVVTGTCLH